MSATLGTDCVRCERWKLFGESACAEHPDFKTEEDKRWQATSESLDVMFFTAGIRTTAALGRTDLLDNIYANLASRSEAFQQKVIAEIDHEGMMTEEEMARSLTTYLLSRQERENG